MCCKLRPSNRQYASFSRFMVILMGFANSLFKFTMRILGPIMFVAANFLAGVVVWILLFVLTPPLLRRNTILYCVNLSFIIWGTINIYFNYWACMLTLPGSPPICENPASVLGSIMTVHEGSKSYKPVEKLSVAPDVEYVYCKLCSRVKPPRTHHCSVSGRCILNMDHYCPWMCNCVGYGNYRYFVLFLVYMSLGSFYVVCYTTSDMVYMTDEERTSVSVQAMLESSVLQNLRAATVSYTVCAFTLALAACVSTSSLLCWHLYLIITNQTTIEFYINMSRRYDPQRKGEYRNPFDEGWRKNLRRVLGDVPWYTHLLPNLTPPAPPKYPFVYSGGGGSGGGSGGVVGEGWVVV